MPHTPMRPCRHPGCPGFCKPGQVYCPTHAPEFSSDAQRGSAAFRGYDHKWQVARRRYLQNNPLCAACMKKDRLEPATVVDHIIPHRGNPRLFWDERNWQPLCKSCHDRKTGGGE
jgi:5-methylcytosine-specific restriction protein A|nr:MAG TPA: HNH endonuclease [Caudoviricetes sp.]